MLYMHNWTGGGKIFSSRTRKALLFQYLSIVTAQYLNVGECRKIDISTIHFCTGNENILAGVEDIP